MKLLIVTQVIDTEHPILGFFHRWVEEFAKHCEQVHVICLQEGKHALPENVTVHSLGKEAGKGRLAYLWRFYTYIWKFRREYDQVFVHMNQIYVILGWLFWKLQGKKIGLWYMHGSVPFSLKIAEKLTDKIFTGSPESFRLKSDKVLVTGHGIDTEVFKLMPEVEKDIDIITVGRITVSKNLDTLLELFADMTKKTGATLTIVGAALSEDEKRYEETLHKKIEELGLQQLVFFPGRISQKELPTLLNRAKLFVTVAQNGSLDKAVLEAMACGLPIVSMAPGTESLDLGEQQVGTAEEFVERCQKLLLDTRDTGGRNRVLQNHSISALIPKILNYGPTKNN